MGKERDRRAEERGGRFDRGRTGRKGGEARGNEGRKGKKRDGRENLVPTVIFKSQRLWTVDSYIG